MKYILTFILFCVIISVASAKESSGSLNKDDFNLVKPPIVQSAPIPKDYVIMNYDEAIRVARQTGQHVIVARQVNDIPRYGRSANKENKLFVVVDDNDTRFMLGAYEIIVDPNSEPRYKTYPQEPSVIQQQSEAPKMAVQSTWNPNVTYTGPPSQQIIQQPQQSYYYMPPQRSYYYGGSIPMRSYSVGGNCGPSG